VVDISRVRLVANVVERDLNQLQAGDPTRVQVDAYPGETFSGRIARVSPVLDPATRTAPIEVEIPNSDYRLKPGMYARVGITMETKKDTLVVPADAMADLGGRRGVFQVLNGSAVFRTVQVGTEQTDIAEIIGGLKEGEQVITTGARALRDGDPVVVAGADGQSGRGQGRRNGGPSPTAGTAPAEAAASDARPRVVPEGSAASEGRRGGGEGGFSGEGRRGRRGGAPTGATATP